MSVNSEDRKTVNYKWCIVPNCSSTTRRTPEKIFVSVPKVEAVRRKWFKAVRRAPQGSYTSPIFCCEDHFKMYEDVDNFMQYKIMGGNVKLRVKVGVVPHIFDCQNDRKRAGMLKPKQSTEERKRKMIISEILSETAYASCSDYAEETSHPEELPDVSNELTFDRSNAIPSSRTAVGDISRKIGIQLGKNKKCSKEEAEASQCIDPDVVNFIEVPVRWDVVGDDPEAGCDAMVDPLAEPDCDPQGLHAPPEQQSKRAPGAIYDSMYSNLGPVKEECLEVQGPVSSSSPTRFQANSGAISAHAAVKTEPRDNVEFEEQKYSATLFEAGTAC